MKRLLIALLSALFILPLAAYGQSHSSRLGAKQIAKAERLVNQLEQFADFINSGPDDAQYKARLRKLADGFDHAAASLPEGDLKTDMATAVYWFEQQAVATNHASDSNSAVAARCAHERPGAYRKLCACSSGSLRDLFWARARLHMSWARAGLEFQKTGQVQRPLDDIAVERKIDQMLAARVVELLKVLEGEVIIYSSLGEFEATGKLGRVPFPVFKRDLQRVAAEAESNLSWLPQNLLKTELSNALHSFQDGAFWWQQIDQPRVVKVSELAFVDRNRSSSESALMTTVPYTVAINWRLGSKYLHHAEQLLNQ